MSSCISPVFQVGQLSLMRSTACPLRTHSTFVLSSHHTTTFPPFPCIPSFLSKYYPGTTASPSAGSCRSTAISLTRILGRQLRHHYSPPAFSHSWSGLTRLSSSSKASEVTRPAFRDDFAAGQSCHAVIVYIHLAAKQNAKSSRCLGPTSTNTKIRPWKFSSKDKWPSHWPSSR